MKDGFILYKKMYEPIRSYANAEKGELLDAIFQYQITGELPLHLSEKVKIAFEFFRVQMDMDETKYTAKCAKNKEVADKRWKDANVCERMQTDSNDTDKDKDKDKEKDKDKDKDKEKDKGKRKRAPKVFIPPTLEEVIEYFTENGYTVSSATKMFNYYNVSNWHDGKGDKIIYWKQKAQAVWFKNENLLTPPQPQTEKVKYVTPKSTIPR